MLRRLISGLLPLLSGAALWCAILTWIGWFLGQHAAALRREDVQRYSTRAILILAPVIVTMLVVYIYRERRASRRGAEVARLGGSETWRTRL